MSAVVLQQCLACTRALGSSDPQRACRCTDPRVGEVWVAAGGSRFDVIAVDGPFVELLHLASGIRGWRGLLDVKAVLTRATSP
jgi:hypothetical protein